LTGFAVNLLVANFAVAAAPESKSPEQRDKPPTVEEMAPDFTLNDLQGRPVTLSELTAKSKVVLVVLRGYPGYQCPLCSIQVSSLISKAKELGDAGAEVVFVYPGPANNLESRAEEFIKGKTFPEHFSFLIDPAYKFTNAWGLRWDAPRETAYPSTFIVDQKGLVRMAKISMTHGDRVKTVDVLKGLSTAE
jgi:peroxiredoxin